MLERTEEYARMAAVEGKLWWYVALHRLVLDALRTQAALRSAPAAMPATPPASLRIIDAGCGTGGLLAFLRAHGFTDVRGFDLSADAVAWCAQRGLDVQRADLLQLDELYPPGSADVIVSNDTLCYLEPPQQEAFVRQCGAVLRPGGLLLANLPAHAAFAGVHDLSVGLRQRFTRADVPRLLQPQTQTFALRRACYWPFLLSPLIWAVRARQRRRIHRAARGAAELVVRSDVELPPRPVNAMLHWLTRFENRWLRRKPFGSSLFLVAQRR